MLTDGVSAIDAAIQRKIPGSETTLILSNKDKEDTMKIVKLLEKPGLLIKHLKRKSKNKKVDYIPSYLVHLVLFY